MPIRNNDDKAVGLGDRTTGVRQSCRSCWFCWLRLRPSTPPATSLDPTPNALGDVDYPAALMRSGSGRTIRRWSL